MSEQDTRRRVKLYMLNKDRFWDDKGTGHVDSVSLEDSTSNSLLVRSEVNSGIILLDSKILTETAYQKQQDTLIVWSENDNYDFALSFQEKAGCDDIWEKICQVQGKDPSVDITHEVDNDIEDGTDDDHYYDNIGDSNSVTTNMNASNASLVNNSATISNINYELPPCELSKLSAICDMFNSAVMIPMRRDNLSCAIEADGYLKKLVDVFHICEDLEDAEGLRYLYDIFKVVFMLNKNGLFETLFSDEMILDVVGILEYEPPRGVDRVERVRHRKYLKENARFCDVVSIDNNDLLSKIHQTYRVQYIQDVILPTPSMLEENMLSSLNSFIFYNKVEIVNMIQEDENFLKSLFEQIYNLETNVDKKRDLTLFLKEYCMYSQSLQSQSRDYSFFKTLSNLGILKSVEVILPSTDDITRSAAIDIFSYIVEFSPTIVREYIISENKDVSESLINVVIKQMVNDKDPELGGAVQLLGVVRILVDPDNMLATENKMELTDFLNYFYHNSMRVLLAPLLANTNPDLMPTDNYRTSQLLALTLELCSFFVEHHSYHCSTYFISKNVLRRVLVLLKSRHTFLRLSALRLFRKVVSMKDEYYNRYLTRNSLFEPIVTAFMINGNRYNLLNSAIIELFEYIQYEDIKCLITHIVESNYFTSFEQIEYVKTFQNLKNRYDQHQHTLKARFSTENNEELSPTNNHQISKRTQDSTCFDTEEDIYFGESDDMKSDMLKEAGEITDITSMPAVSELFSSQIGNDREQISKFMERSRVNTEETDEIACRIKPMVKHIPINISLTTNTVNTPHPVNNSIPVNKPAILMTSLVDYPDEDSDEECDQQEVHSNGNDTPPKVARLST